jgi:predicted ATPase
VAAICRRLDGLPLALELVAARVRVLSPAEILARLDRQMPLLVGGARDLPKRQQTMRAAIAWSYELLDPAGQALFRRLSVFAGGWTLEMAEGVGGDDGEDAGEVLDRLDALVERSLVRVVLQGSASRYSMLEPIRQYALEQLETSAEAEGTWRRHATYFQEFAERARVGLEGRAGQTAWLERLDREHDNLRAALAWSERAPDGAEIGLRLAGFPLALLGSALVRRRRQHLAGQCARQERRAAAGPPRVCAQRRR